MKILGKYTGYKFHLFDDTHEEEWLHEPDYLCFIDDDTNYICEVKRMYCGHLCGYVHIGKSHYLHKKDLCWCSDEMQNNPIAFSVHGGITYCEMSDLNDGDWVVGFDCAHAGDYVPEKDNVILSNCERYGNLDYVIDECKSLAKQLYNYDKIEVKL